MTRTLSGRRAASLLLVALGSCALLLSVPFAGTSSGTESSRTTADELGLQVQVGFDGQTVRRAWLPVTVTMAPTRPFQGRLRVLVHHGGGRQVSVEEVEVPAGSAKVFRSVVPPTERVEVQAVPDDGDGVQVDTVVQRPGNYLVGVLGRDVPDSAPPLRAYALDIAGSFVEVDPAWLDHDTALTSLSALLVEPEVLQGLSESQRRALRVAVVSGLDLVVQVTTPGDVELDHLGLVSPATTVEEVGASDALAVGASDGAWTLTADEIDDDAGDQVVAAATPAGLGRVVVVGTGLGAGDLGSDGAYWGMLLQPSARSGGTVGDDGEGQLLTIAAEGIQSGRLQLPSMGWFAVFLLAYVVVVGPVNGFVLWRAGRRELAWITVPAVTVVFAVGAWITSGDQTPPLGQAGRAAYWIDGAGSELAVTALRAARPDEHTVGFEGDGWSVMSAAWSAPAIVRNGPAGVEVDLALEAMQVGTVLGRRPTQEDAPLSVAARVVEDGVELEVSNPGAHPIEDVTIRAGTAKEAIGTLEAGESRNHTFETRGTLPVDQAWHDPFTGMRAPDGSVTAPRSLEALLRFDVLDGNPGLVWVTGTMAAGTSVQPVTVGGSRASDQGTFVAVGVTPGPADADLSPFEVGRQLITTGFGHAHRPGPLAIEGQTEAVLRFRLPRAGDLVELESTLGRGQIQVGHFGGEHICEAEEVDVDEGTMTREICGPESLLVELRDACPQDANHCALEDHGALFVCANDGSCVSRPLTDELVAAVEEVRGGAGDLQIYDGSSRGWRPVDEVFDDDGRLTDPDPYVSPLGEVFVRVSGEFFPFDYSGRGLGGRFAS